MRKLLLVFATALLIPGMLGKATPVAFSFSIDTIGAQEASWGAIESRFRLG